jgi:hypothetical protein
MKMDKIVKRGLVEEDGRLLNNKLIEEFKQRFQGQDIVFENTS